MAALQGEAAEEAEADQVSFPNFEIISKLLVFQFTTLANSRASRNRRTRNDGYGYRFCGAEQRC